MRNGQRYQTGLARPRWGAYLGALILASQGLIVPAELRAQSAKPAEAAPPPPPPAGLPTAVTGGNDSQLLSLDGLDSDVAEELPRLRLSDRRPVSGPGSVSSFIDGLKGNDAAFEVKIGQGRILTLKQDLIVGGRQPLIAVGNPSMIEFTLLNSRQLRITGLGVGDTDLSISTGQGEVYSFEVRVTADFSLLQGRLHAAFPDASIKIGQIRNQVIVEGEARDNAQVQRILDAIHAYLQSMFIGQGAPGTGGQPPGMVIPSGSIGAPSPDQAAPPAQQPRPDQGVTPVAATQIQAGLPPAFGTVALQAPVAGTGGAQNALWTVVNLLRVPGSQQVMLKVRIAELNRSALRAIGSNFLGVDPRTGSIVGSQIAGPVSATGAVTRGLFQRNQEPGYLIGAAQEAISPLTSSGGTTVFGIFRDGNFMFTFNALRRNSLLKILAEPNLVAYNGQVASFLAGGQYPVPVPQVGAAGLSPVVTIRFKDFGVRLGFVPYILDGDRIRLTVAPEVSQIDFSIAVTLIQGGSPVPGLNTRKALTTVELQQGQTLAIAGLMQLQMDGSTQRIPGLGDLPIIGPFFSNTSGDRIEKELVVLVTPYLIEPMNHDQVPPTPGDEVKEPNDLELYLLNRIEGRTGKDFRSTTKWDDVYHLRDLLKLEKKYIQGPVGFSE